MIERFIGKFTNLQSAVIEGEITGSTGLSADVPAVTANVHPVAAPTAQFGLGEIVRHRFFPFRGVIIDVDPEFSNSEAWYQAIPEAIRPHKNQPFYHLLAENDDATTYVAYVSQQNLVRDDTPMPITHPVIAQLFGAFEDGRYVLRRERAN